MFNPPTHYAHHNSIPVTPQFVLPNLHEPTDPQTKAVDSHEELQTLREISDLAHWSLTSFKAGHGLAELRSSNSELYWQSDAGATGPPHILTLTFPKKITLTKVKFLIQNIADESYCPRTIKIRAGTSHHDVQDAALWSLNDYPEAMEVKDWVSLDLWEDEDESRPLRARMIQLMIVNNVNDGKDTHLRGFRIYAPK
ncbi:Anaphase-promoting complex subunit 10, partial [Rhizophlyctis rosea]